MEQTGLLFKAISTADLTKLVNCPLDQQENLEMEMLMKYDIVAVPG